MAPSEKIKALTEKLLKEKLNKQAAVEARKKASKDAGDEGERYVSGWLKLRGISFVFVDEMHKSGDERPEIFKEVNAKRPDFYVVGDDVTWCIDAKHHNTHGRTIFFITAVEFKKYQQLVKLIRKEIGDEEAEFAFALIQKDVEPRELAWLSLDDFETLHVRKGDNMVIELDKLDLQWEPLDVDLGKDLIRSHDGDASFRVNPVKLA